MSIPDVKEKLLAAALRLFVAEGYDDVSVDRLRRAAGVSNGSFFHAFPSKPALAAALLADCVEDYQRAVLAGLGEGETAGEGLAGAVGAKLDWVEDHPARARFMLDDARAAWFALAAARLARLNADFAAGAEAWRAPHLASGALRPVSAEAFRAVLLGPANIACRMWLQGLRPELDRPLSLKAELAEAARLALLARP